MLSCTVCGNKYLKEELTQIKNNLICDPCLMVIDSQQTKIKYIKNGNVNSYNFHSLLGITDNKRRTIDNLPKIKVVNDQILVDDNLHHLEKDMIIKFFGMNEYEKKLIGLVRNILSGKEKLNGEFMAVISPHDQSLKVNLYCHENNKKQLSEEVKSKIKQTLVG